MRIISWNVNGLRAAERKGFKEWVLHESPDILCLQETKAHASQLSEELLNLDDYQVYFSEPVRKGYSGVALYTLQEPKSIGYDLGIKKYDQEGRVIMADYGKFILFNIYFPNGGASPERLKYKLAFYDDFLKYLKKFKNKKIIITGDYNTAHHEIDLARPKQNEKNSGFMPLERKRLDKLEDLGFVDTFRIFNQAGENYTWWDVKTRSRERNVGWRIDYFWASKNLAPKITKAFIMPEVTGSDHCPIGLDLAS